MIAIRSMDLQGQHEVDSFACYTLNFDFYTDPAPLDERIWRGLQDQDMEGVFLALLEGVSGKQYAPVPGEAAQPVGAVTTGTRAVDVGGEDG